MEVEIVSGLVLGDLGYPFKDGVSITVNDVIEEATRDLEKIPLE